MRASVVVAVRLASIVALFACDTLDGFDVRYESNETLVFDGAGTPSKARRATVSRSLPSTAFR